jgi:hypothetical protein
MMVILLVMMMVILLVMMMVILLVMMMVILLVMMAVMTVAAAINQVSFFIVVTFNGGRWTF